MPSDIYLEDMADDAAPRRATRSTAPDAPASSRRRRSVEPVRFQQLQDQERAMARLKYEQLRKGDKRRLDAKPASAARAKRSRAEARRSARQARRREAMSPSLGARDDADEEDDEDEEAWRALPPMALDGSGATPRRFARAQDALVAVLAPSTAWRARRASVAPRNLLHATLLEPFARELDRPLDAYDELLASWCELLRPCVAVAKGSLQDDVQPRVEALVGEATPLVKRCHNARVAHIVGANRESVRACLAQLPASREAVSATLARGVVKLEIPKLQQLTVATMLETTIEHDEDEMPVYAVGRGENTVRERGQLPKEMVRLRQLPAMSRSTTCIGVRDTLPVDDDPIIRYVPFFSQATKPDAQLPTMETTHKTPLSALDDEVREFVLRYVVRAVDGDARVFQALRDAGWCLQPQTDYAELLLRDARRRVAALLPAESRSGLRQRLASSVGEGSAPTRDSTELLAAFRMMFCRRCYVYNCQCHGVHQPVPASRIDPVYPAMKKSLRHVFEHEIVEDERLDEDDTVETEVVTTEISETVVVEESEELTKEMTGEDVAMPEVRRSARSGTVLATKSSSILVGQLKKPRKRQHNGTARSGKHDRLAESSEYFGLAATYHKITSAACAGVLAGREGEVCSEDCHVKASEPRKEAPWTANELLLLRLAERKVGNCACLIAPLLRSKTCAQVYSQLETKSSSEQDELAIARAELRELLRPRGPQQEQVALVRGNTQEHLLRTRSQRMKDRGSNHQYVPCHHAGSASCNSNDCACMRRDHFCEKSCGCALDCANRFPGCQCARGECGTMECPCYFSGRECDPDVCRSCGACEVPLLALDPTSQAKSNKALRVCWNTNILRGAHRKIGVAESTTHGWGAFALEEISEGDFIYEYTGELLSQDEAERRGNVYDRNAVSFLFDLNEDAVVDAARKGNKSKFANHSSVNPNCAARIMLVKGDHRIGLYAKRKIAAGEELFFDYGHHGVVPDWSQSRIRSSVPKGMEAPPSGGPSSVEESSAPTSPRRPVEVEENGWSEDENGDVEMAEDSPTGPTPPEAAEDDDVILVDD